MRALVQISAPRYVGLTRTVAIAASRPTAPLFGRESTTLTRASSPCTCLRWSSSNSRWKLRQGSDFFAREAKVKGLKSRAAFKLLEMDAKYHLFKRGQTVIDLGYAPGSWSQVAVDRTKPNGRVVGIDLIPAQPPKGVSTIQGNFLSPVVQNMVKEYLVEFAHRNNTPDEETEDEAEAEVVENDEAFIAGRPSYIDTERAESTEHDHETAPKEEKLVDIVLSDMMMNTSGMSFRDHAGSMDLCLAALQFASDTLRTGGHFVCKFYQGAEDKELELKLKKMFGKVHREKPESSRSESREAYFVALRRKGNVTLEDVS